MADSENSSPLSQRCRRLDGECLDAVIFDLDGVVTDTRRAHEAAWKRLFDEYAQERGQERNPVYDPFTHQDYLEHLDGKPRYDGVRDFLSSRGIDLPWGVPGDSPRRETICGLGNRKNGYFSDWLKEHKVDTFPDALALLHHLKEIGIKTAIISASKSCGEVLDNAGIADLFDAKVDGRVMAEQELPGKPDPAIFLKAAKRLKLEPNRTAVIEDALAGVEAGSKGGFALVVGVDRSKNQKDSEALDTGGATLVTHDLRELIHDRQASEEAISLKKLPSAWEHRNKVAARLKGKRLATVLDYDGTLTPIVEDYTQAKLSDKTRNIVRELANTCSVAIISGRDLEDVRERVDLDQLFYAGSHGFDLAGPNNWREQLQQAVELLPDLDQAEKTLTQKLASIDGAVLERKRFSLAVHYRQVADDRVTAVQNAVEDVVDKQKRLRKSSGKKVFDIQPAVEWHKGKALNYLLEQLDLGGPEVVPLYIGDDVTDEDAFSLLKERIERGTDAIAIAVRDGEGSNSDTLTKADYALDTPEEVADFLAWLTKNCEEADHEQ